MTDLIGRTIQDYEIRKALQSDLTFALYQAQHLQTGEKVILWLVFPERECSPTFNRELLERLELLELLEHPNLMPIQTCGELDGKVYWIAPEIPGKLLSDLLSKPTAEKEAAAITAQAAAGLDYLHKQGLLHERLSPETVLIDQDGRVLLFHYAITAILNREVRRSVPEDMLGYGIGSPAYLAPEQILGREATPHADLYALGALFYSLLCALPPYPAGTHNETALRKLHAPLAWPRKLPGKISSTAVRLVHRCMSRQPEDRFEDAGQALQVLARLQQGKGTRVRVRAEQMAGAPRSPRWVLWLGLLAVVLLAGGWFAYPYYLAIQPAQPPAAGEPISQSGEVTKTAVAPKAATVTPTSAATPAPTRTPRPAQAQAAAPTDAPAAEPAPEQSPLSPWPVLIGTPAPGEPGPVTAENITQLREAARFGLGKFYQVAITPDDQTVAVAAAAGVILVQEGQITAFYDLHDQATSVQFSPEGDRLAIGLINGEIQLWDWRSHQVLTTFTGHSGRISRIVYTPNRRQLVSASFDLNIKVWDVNTGELIRTMPGHPLPIRDLSISGDGRVLASASEDQLVKIWNMADGKKITEFRHTAPLHAVSVSPDGVFVAAAGDNGEIRQWNIATGMLRSDPYVFNTIVWSLYYNDDASSLTLGLDGGKTASAPGKYSNRNWSRNTQKLIRPSGELINTLGGAFELSAHTAVNSSGFNASVTWEGELQIDGKSIIPNGTTFEDITRLAFSPNSRHLIASGKLEKVWIWDLETNRLGGQSVGVVPPGSPFTSDSQFVTIISEGRIEAKKAGEKDLITDLIRLYRSGDLNKALELSEYPAGAAVQFALDNNLLIAGTLNRSKFWDTNSGYETYLREGNNLGCQVTRSANDETIFTIYSPLGIMTEWDDSARLICSRGGGFGTRPAAFAPSRLWLTYINENGLLEMLSTADNQVAWRSPVEHPISSLAFSPDDRLLVTGSPDGTLTVWDVQTGQALHTFTAHYGPVRVVAFSPDSKRIASGSADGMVRIWEVLP